MQETYEIIKKLSLEKVHSNTRVTDRITQDISPGHAMLRMEIAYKVVRCYQMCHGVIQD